MKRALFCFLLSAAAPAQSPSVELSAEEAARLGVRLVAAASGDVREVTWGKARIPLKSPTKACAIGHVAGSNDLVILAGGVHDTLDLYLVKAGGEFHRHATGGGRRLPRKWNGGQGSWPVLEGRHLVFFAYERDSGIEFRVLDFAGRVLAARRLPLSVEGWSISSEPEAGRVTVQFGKDLPPVVFRHPRAARLELSTGLVQFGDVEVGRRGRQLLHLSNAGARPLRLRGSLEHPAFELDGALPGSLAPGQRLRVLVHFAPAQAGEVEARLKFVTTGAVPEHLVVLRGRGIARDAPAGPEVVPSAPAQPPVPAPQVRVARVHPLGGGRVLVLGELAAAGRVALRDATGARVVVSTDQRARFHARVAAAAGQAIGVAAVSAEDRTSAFVRFAVAPPMLEVRDSEILVRSRPERPFRLEVRSGGDVIRRLRGTIDASGVKRLPLVVLGEGESPPLQLRVSVEDQGRWRASPLVDVPR